MLIKSKEALLYSELFRQQCPRIDPLIEDDVAIWVDAYYSSRRPDLNCIDMIKDLMEGSIYKNDRQVKAEAAVWNLSKDNPGVRIRLTVIPQSGSTEMSSFRPSEIWGEELILREKTLSDG